MLVERSQQSVKNYGKVCANMSIIIGEEIKAVINLIRRLKKKFKRDHKTEIIQKMIVKQKCFKIGTNIHLFLVLL